MGDVSLFNKDGNNLKLYGSFGNLVYKNKTLLEA
jgi:hypothetical protein